MVRAGYVRHCLDAGRVCYHRSICDPHVFPRFHAFVDVRQGGMDIDLHLDQFNFKHKSNHAQPWAYTGGRIDQEMSRLVEAIKSPANIRRVNQPNRPQPQNKSAGSKQKKSLFDILFK